MGCNKETNKTEGPKTTTLPMKVAKYYWPGQFWVEIADKKGWFKDAGLNVELIDTNLDYVGSLGDMVTGKMDTHNFSLFDLMKSNLAGADMRMVINVDSSFGAEVILAKPEIESIRDLKGKSIGVSRNSYLEYILSVALAGENVSINDVTIIDMPSEKSVEALSKGMIDAVIAWGPFAEKIIKNRIGHKIFDTSEVSGISPNGYTFHQSFIEKRPGDVQAFVNVWYKTVNLIKENPQEAFGIIADIYDKTTDEVQSYAQGEKLLDLRENLAAFSFGSGFTSLHGTVRRINNFMIEKGTVKEQLDSTKFIDSRFIHALK